MDYIRTEKYMLTLVDVETYCRPMNWAVVTVVSDKPNDEFVIAQFYSENDAKFFVEKLPSQGLQVRRITCS